jgi:diketogulonate reductase-like aldo/keto reductase
VPPTARLRDGRELPLIGLGVWEIPDGEPTIDAVRWSLEAGYRHIDTARLYANERSVGEGVRRSGIPREEVWITTKLRPADFPRAERALARSVRELGFEYVDLYLVHWPVPGTVKRTWKAMERLCESGIARTIGVSNYSPAQLRAVLDVASIPPAVNQVKFSPFGFDETNLEFCARHEIVVEAYSPLTRGRRLADARVGELAARYERSPAQVLLRWALQKGTVVLPKSANRERIAENIAVFEFELSPADMQALDALNARIPRRRANQDPGAGAAREE